MSEQISEPTEDHWREAARRRFWECHVVHHIPEKDRPGVRKYRLLSYGDGGRRQISWDVHLFDVLDSQAELDAEQSKYARLREKAQAVIDAGEIPRNIEYPNFWYMISELREELEHGA